MMAISPFGGFILLLAALAGSSSGSSCRASAPN
jgi:hypothetical protein